MPSSDRFRLDANICFWSVVCAAAVTSQTLALAKALLSMSHLQGAALFSSPSSSKRVVGHSALILAFAPIPCIYRPSPLLNPRLLTDTNYIPVHKYTRSNMWTPKPLLYLPGASRSTRRRHRHPLMRQVSANPLEVPGVEKLSMHPSLRRLHLHFITILIDTTVTDVLEAHLNRATLRISSLPCTHSLHQIARRAACVPRRACSRTLRPSPPMLHPPRPPRDSGGRTAPTVLDSPIWHAYR